MSEVCTFKHKCMCVYVSACVCVGGESTVFKVKASLRQREAMSLSDEPNLLTSEGQVPVRRQSRIPRGESDDLFVLGKKCVCVCDSRFLHYH